MVARLEKADILARADIVAAPAQRACEDRTFGLPPVLHFGTFGLYLAYIGVMALGFQHQEMVLPVIVFGVFIVAFCAVPAMWAMMNPAESRTKALGWAEFIEKGIETATGRSSGRDAAVLVMTMPVMLLFWGLAIVTIAAMVR